MKTLEIGEVVSLGDLYFYYVYELLDDSGDVVYIGSTCDVKATLLSFTRPVTKRRFHYVNRLLMEAVSDMIDPKVRIVAVSDTQEDSERLRDSHIRSVSKFKKLYNFETRVGLE